MKSRATIIILFLFSLLISCSREKENIVIGVSQCSEDSWRQKLKQELIMTTYVNPGVELIFTSANDDSELQQRQIDSLVN